MSKQTGIVKAILGFINSNPETWTLNELALQFSNKYTPTQVSNAANYLARNGSISREGYAGHFTYSQLPPAPPPIDEVDVIERLLTVMAEAEPVLRRLQAAHRAFSGIPMPRKEAD